MIDGTVHIRRHPCARRMKLRVDPVTGDAVLTLPRGVARAEGMGFLDRNRDWIAARRAAIAPPVPFMPGFAVPFRGHRHMIVQTNDQPGIWLDVDKARIVCGGPVRGIELRLKDWFVARAREHLAARVDHYAHRIDRTVTRVRIGDPRTRWGSCSSTGTLSFSWRLIMAPVAVSDYVVAHEVAHMLEMNHSPAFWRVVDSLVDDSDRAREWLRREGAALHRIGVIPPDQSSCSPSLQAGQASP